MAERNQPRRADLDEPMERTRAIRVHFDPDMFGRVSEIIARYIGSWKFIAWMTVLIVAWVVLNVIMDLTGGGAPDPFPFIFLTLLLSLQASYAAPLILLAQNRQADRDRIQYYDDRARTERLIADTEYLVREIAALRIALGEVATRDYLRGELRDLTEELGELLAGEEPDPRRGDAR